MVSPGTKQKIFNCMSSPRKRKKVKTLVPINPHVGFCYSSLVDGQYLPFLLFNFIFNTGASSLPKYNPLFLLFCGGSLGIAGFVDSYLYIKGGVNRIESIGSNQLDRINKGGVKSIKGIKSIRSRKKSWY